MMTKIIRTREEIQALMMALKDQSEALPDYNLWGESTESSKEEMRQWVFELQVALDEGRIEGDEWDSEISYWLTNEKSYFAKDWGL